MKYFFLVDVFLLSSKSSSWQMPQKIDFFLSLLICCYCSCCVWFFGCQPGKNFVLSAAATTSPASPKISL